jgi:uncharacterized membrane protein YhaH (DUF805 family)
MELKSFPVIEQTVHAVRTVILDVGDYRGRGTRTDLCLGLAFVNGCAELASDSIQLLTDRPLMQYFIVAIALTLIAPLLVRRVHDMGYAAWWLLVPLSAIPLSTSLTFFDITLVGADSDNATMLIDVSNLGLLALPLGIMLMIPFFAPDELHENRFGPNPRYPEPEAASA